MSERLNSLTVQSRNWLSNSLLTLMNEKPFNKITISEIAEKAELDRRTFYRHFVSKENILDYCIENLYREYLRDLFEEPQLTIYSVARLFFEFWKDHLDFLLTISWNHLESFLLYKFNKYLPQIYEALKIESLQEVEEYRYAFAFKIGGFWNVLFQWIQNGAKQEPDEMAGIISDLVMSKLAVSSLIDSRKH